MIRGNLGRRFKAIALAPRGVPRFRCSLLAVTHNGPKGADEYSFASPACVRGEELKGSCYEGGGTCEEGKGTGILRPRGRERRRRERREREKRGGN